MARHTRRTAVADYLTHYPEIARRWINRCALCGHVGHKPDMPRDAPGAHYVRYELDPLALDAQGRCELCAAAAARMTDADSD